ncbi:hypothetical protein ACIRBX_19140 [Kitasatospora sp. NPDC096147]|uniref:hypothetical protein n=1 Tax=Kitasatospora sp. NPDC096147 TaxID=3364093 RepID=UPI0037FE7C4A
MDQALVDRMWQYLHAGLAMDLEALEELYDPEFENLRVDRAGLSVRLVKEQFMRRFRALRAEGRPIGDSLADVSFVATTVYPDHGSIVMRREEEDGLPVLYDFTWRREDGRWTSLLRELTVEQDLRPLLAVIAAGTTAAAGAAGEAGAGR